MHGKGDGWNPEQSLPIDFIAKKNIDFYHQGPTQLQNTITGNCDAKEATCPVDTRLTLATSACELSAH